MSKITLTFTFDTEAELKSFLDNRGGASTGSTSTKSTKQVDDAPAKEVPPKASKPKHTREMMEAALTKVKDSSGADNPKPGIQAAKAIISGAGGASKMAEIPDENIGAVIEACEAKLKELAEAAEGM